MKRQITSVVVALGVVMGLFGAMVRAEEKAANVAGAWKWQMPGRDGADARDITLTLKQDGEKVTGSLTGRGGRETEIKDAKLSGNTLSFTVTREFNGNTFTQKFSGKVEADTITGKIATERDGQARERDWTAKREKAKTAAADGTWKMEREFNGNTFVSTLKLKADGEKLTGTSQMGDRPAIAIENGKITGNAISYTVTRERDGNKVTSKFSGKVEGDKIVGQTTANWGGEERTFDAEYTRVKE